MTAQTTSAVPAKTNAITGPAESQRLLDQMERVYDAVARRAFEIFDGNGRTNGRDLGDWLQAESEILHPMHLELFETDDALTVKAEVPGFTAKELDVQAEGNRLTISGRHESKEERSKGKTIYSEQCAKEVFRSIALPSVVDPSKVNATLKDGVLTVELPRAAKGKSIPIEAKAGN
jgi:HSP20 family protein